MSYSICLTSLLSLVSDFSSKGIVGNSSSGIKEASYFGVPVVNIGTRQQGRARGENVIDAAYDTTAIKTAINRQLEHGAYTPSLIYYKPETSKRMRNILKTVPLYTQKQFNDISLGTVQK